MAASYRIGRDDATIRLRFNVGRATVDLDDGTIPFRPFGQPLAHTQPRCAMKFLFDNQSFSFEALRAAGFAGDGGADLGEVLVTARNIPEGDEGAWHREWKATADRVFGLAEGSADRVGAREAFLRASNYYRTAEFYLRERPETDPEVAHLSGRSAEAFRRATELMDTPVHPVAIPYEGTTLPGYLFLADGTGTPRPTIVYNNGFDSTLEESWFAIAAAALRRGYHVLAFDGPGQGAALRGQGLRFRPDWEAVITPVLDVAVARPEVDPAGLVLFGYSMGGYLVARAAAHDHRVAAILLDDGILDFHAAFQRMLPPWLAGWIADGRDELANPVLELVMAADTQARWAFRNGIWTYGAGSPADFVRRTRDYTLQGCIEDIRCPALVLDPEHDQFLAGQPELVHKALTAPSTLVTLREADGAGEHCHVGAMSRLHQVIFEWLAGTVPAPR
jgi:pimeloyl-ACP methyl ester carboxylesterase